MRLPDKCPRCGDPWDSAGTARAYGDLIVTFQHYTPHGLQACSPVLYPGQAPRRATLEGDTVPPCPPDPSRSTKPP